MSEHKIQNEIRNGLAGRLPLFRVNVGKAWTGSRTERLPGPGNRVLIYDARPFETGLPSGFSDLFGVLRVTITPEMVGQVVGVAVFGEVKTDTGRVSPKQSAFLEAMRGHGARAGVWRSLGDAIEALR